MHITPIKTPLLKVSDTQPVVSWVMQQLEDHKSIITENSIIALSSKAISYLQGRVISLETITPSQKAVELSRKHNRDPRLTELIIQEAGEIVQENQFCYLTLKNGIYCANAGIDTSNVPEDYVALWPNNPQQLCQELHSQLSAYYKLKNLGIMIIDSICIPGRKGTVAVGIASYGFSPLQELVGQTDLFGKELKYSNLNILDSIATAANLVMGENTESTPIAIINNLPVEFTNSQKDLTVDPSEDLFKLEKV